MTVVIAVAALVRDGRILLAHRHPDRAAYPDCWDLVGGHVDPDETPEQAVVRECAEEIGVRIHDPRPVAYGCSDPALTLHAFAVHAWDGDPVNAAPDEHDALVWFGADDLAALPLAHPAGRSDLEALARGRLAR